MISVVIPCHNAKHTLAPLLADLTVHSSTRGPYEVWVVDDGSTDGTAELATSFGFVRVLTTKQEGPGVARQRGMEAASGEVVVFLDADVRIESDLIETHARFHEEHPDIVAMGGSVLPAGEPALCSWQLVDHLCSWFNAHPGVEDNLDAEYLPSLNFSVKKPMVVAAGVRWEGGMEHTGEDVVFCHALRQHGMRIAFHPAATVRHCDRQTMGGYLRHMYRWGEHAPFVRGTLRGAKYGWLIPNQPLKLIVTLPLIVVGYSALIWWSWRRTRCLQATCCLPQIVLGRLAYAWGVLQGTRRLRRLRNRDSRVAGGDLCPR